MSADLFRALNYVLYDAPLRAHDALATFETVADFEAHLPEFLAKFRFKPENTDKFLQRLADYKAGKLFPQMAKHKIEVITPDDSGYPDILKELPDYPLALFFKGNLDHLKKPMMAVVGSRKCSDYGRRMATRFAEIVGPYFTVVSGLAEGIDTAAHQGALNGSFPTIAITGTGLDRVYPAQNAQLARSIEASGLILSEYPPDTGIWPSHFPQRNRIIAGLAQGTLVIEAAAKSGALITARLATEQGREVFVIPGEIDTPFSTGSHQLIQEGAKLVSKLPDILDEFPHLEVRNLNPIEAPHAQTWGFVSETETQILTVLKSKGESSVDTLIEYTGLSVMQILKALTTLQEKKLIAERPGQKYAVEIDLQK